MKSGIYKIYNNISGKSYIGSSENIPRRLKDHKVYLKNNTHPSTHLQNSYNKYGVSVFEYSILEYCKIPALEERETYWVSTIPLEKRYNQRAITKSNRGMKWSEEAKKKLKGRKPWNIGTKGLCKATAGCIKKGQRIGKETEFKKGLLTWNKGTRGVCKPNKTSYKPKFFALVSPDNILYEGYNLAKFCKETGNSQSGLNNVTIGKRKVFKGWRLPSDNDIYNGIGLWLEAA